MFSSGNVLEGEREEWRRILFEGGPALGDASG